MKLVVFTILSGLSIFSFGARKPAQTHQEAVVDARKFNQAATVGIQCVNDIKDVQSASIANNLNHRQEKFLKRAVDEALDLAKSANMVRLTVVYSANARVQSAGDATAAVVTLCDQADRGQANCMEFNFGLAKDASKRPHLLMAQEDWHTSVGNIYYFCQSKDE